MQMLVFEMLSTPLNADGSSLTQAPATDNGVWRAEPLATTLQAESASDLLFAGDYLAPDEDSWSEPSLVEPLAPADSLDGYREALSDGAL